MNNAAVAVEVPPKAAAFAVANTNARPKISLRNLNFLFTANRKH